jgi:carboxylesterase type B
MPLDARRHPNLPVILHIHGGSYYFGSGNEIGPSYLLNKDVILISFSFR